MSRVLYYVVLKPLSYLPLSVLYPISDFLYFLVYQIFGYRKKVVYQNIKNSFPTKTETELLKIQSEFYRHLCDVIVESMRLFSITKEEAKRRFKIINPEILDKFYEDNQSVILVGGHYNNWEITGTCIDMYSPHQVAGIYNPLSNKFFEKVFAESRTKFGVELITRAMVPRAFVKNRNRAMMTVFGADQSPTFSKQVHWMQFMNQETAVHVGTEIFAKKFNQPVVFIRVDKVKRGNYEGRYEVICINSKDTKDGEITELHTRMLEKIINEKPQYWLWSHKRWKRKKTDEERHHELDAA